MTSRHKTPKELADATHHARALRTIQVCSDINRDDLLRVLTRRRNRGARGSTNVTWAQAVHRADAWAAGRRLRDLTGDEWSAMLAALRDQYRPSTLYTMAGYLKATLTDLLDLDEAPKRLRRALTIREESRRPKGCLITDDQMTALLETASTYTAHGWNDLQRLQLVTMLRVLRDSGFRAHEALALRNGSVMFSGAHAAYLRLPDDAASLKTGPREIAVVSCVPSLKAWMAIHPAAGDTQAPLFPGVRSRQGSAPMAYNQLSATMRRLGAVSGINSQRAADEPLTCHDFRHTRATEAARNNWHPTKMEAYFGWSPGSRMAAWYSHLARSDLRDQVLRDAGLLATGEPLTSHKSDPSKALAALLKQLVQEA